MCDFVRMASEHARVFLGPLSACYSKCVNKNAVEAHRWSISGKPNCPRYTIYYIWLCTALPTEGCAGCLRGGCAGVFPCACTALAQLLMTATVWLVHSSRKTLSLGSFHTRSIATPGIIVEHIEHQRLSLAMSRRWCHRKQTQMPHRYRGRVGLVVAWTLGILSFSLRLPGR